MLWIGLMARDTGIPASRRLQIRDEVTALEFDAAVSLRLLNFDNDQAKGLSRLIAYEVSKIFGGGRDDDVLNSPVIGDKYSDGNTQIW
jgi:hypothetical protein